MLQTSISVDWLQLNCRGIIHRNIYYQFKKLSISTRVFSVVEELYFADELICTIASVPKSKILPPDTFMIKFSNKYLYSTDIFSESRKVVADLHLKIIGITRLDLAVDFHKFLNGLLPGTLIRDFMANKYLKFGNTRYKLIGNQALSHRFSYLRFGANVSKVSAYLYNKSLEMNEVTLKQHIVEKWKNEGLNVLLPVWRLEFSFKSNQLHILKKSTGQIYHITFDALQNDDTVTDLFSSALSSYFRFKINDGNKNKSRMPDLLLFENLNYDSKLIALTSKKDSSRADRIFIKKMEMYNNELRLTKLEQAFSFEKIIQQFVVDRNLSSYYRNLSLYLQSSL